MGTFILGLVVGVLIGVLVTSVLLLEKEFDYGREENVHTKDNR